MKIEVILYILFVHWVADFVCQSNWEATNKSKSWNALLSHTSTYSSIWILAGFFWLFFEGLFTGVTVYVNFWMLLFPVITFITHTAIDYYTSRVNKQLAKKAITVENDPNYHQFFVSIGFDQLCHYTQLFLTYYLLSKL